MAQASSWWQQFFAKLPSLPDQRGLRGRSAFPFARYRLQQPLARLTSTSVWGGGVWLVILTAAVTMLFWNWRLLLATGLGVLIMRLVYLAQERGWQQYLVNLRVFLHGPHRQLAFAVGSGGAATLFAYIAASVWLDAESGWLAAWDILQGVGILAILILLLWSLLHHQINRHEAQLDRQLDTLTDPDPLKRLIAVRQITCLLANQHCDRSYWVTVTSAFRLMLDREPEVLVQEAVLDGLHLLETHKSMVENHRFPQHRINASHATAVKFSPRSHRCWADNRSRSQTIRNSGR